MQLLKGLCVCVCVCEHVCVCAQLCLALCNPLDCSPPSSSVHGISQARILGYVAISSSRGSSQPRDWTCVSCIGRWILTLCCLGRADKPPWFIKSSDCSTYIQRRWRQHQEARIASNTVRGLVQGWAQQEGLWWDPGRQSRLLGCLLAEGHNGRSRTVGP